jgi:hypothetical protein
MDSNYNNSSIPLHDFAGLAKLLDDLGFPRVEKQTFRVVKEELQKAIEADKVIFDDDGIKFIFEGSKINAYVYKEKYNVEKYGLPRFHVFNCKTIQKFRDLGRFETAYVISNSKLVNVIDTSKDNLVLENQDLNLCGNCQALKDLNFSTTSGFADMQVESEFNKYGAHNTQTTNDVEVDINGYTLDWQSISQATREAKRFTCEACNFVPPTPDFNRFMHIHHINHKKIDNRASNLQCLCIACHAKVDDSHRERFSKGDNLAQLNTFLKNKP